MIAKSNLNPCCRICAESIHTLGECLGVSAAERIANCFKLVERSIGRTPELRAEVQGVDGSPAEYQADHF